MTARKPTREQLWQAYEHAAGIYRAEGASERYEAAWDQYSALILARWGDPGLSRVRSRVIKDPDPGTI